MIKSALLSSWSMLVPSFRFSRILYILGIMLSLQLININLEWNSNICIRHLFDVLSIYLRLYTQHTMSSKQRVEVRIEQNEDRLSIINRLCIIQQRHLDLPQIISHRTCEVKIRKENWAKRKTYLIGLSALLFQLKFIIYCNWIVL